MLRRPLILVSAVIGAAVVAVGAAGALAPTDAKAVRASLRDAKTLRTALLGQRVSAVHTIAVASAPCRSSYQPAGDRQRQRVAQLLAVEVLRQLQHDGLADYSSFIGKVRGRAVSDARLRTARDALATELDIAQKVTAVQITPCDDLKQLAAGGYSQKALEAWARRIDRKAGVKEADGSAADAHVNASRNALGAAGLTNANATLVLHAETGDLFADVLSG